MNTVNQDHPRTIAHILNYLVKESNLEYLVISILSINERSCNGSYGGNRFYCKLSKNGSLLVKMQSFSVPLMDAFSISVADLPFCQYRDNGLIAIEWPTDPDKIYEEIGNDNSVTFLRKFI